MISAVVVSVFMIAAFAGCVPESRYLKNEAVDNIVNRQPLPPPPPDAACYSLPRFRVVSLKQAQKASREGLAGDENSDSVRYLCGLKSVEGFFIDRKNKDILLIGKVDDTMPGLRLDDFIIALRCAWKAYVVGNLFTPPGCSIDPSPQMLKDLSKVKERIFAEETTSGWEKHQEDFEKACRVSQTERVLGMPFNTHFASVLVNADYDMKRLVDGSDNIDIPGVLNLYALSSYDLRRSMLAKADAKGPSSILSRFWFKPGRIGFVERQNMVMLDEFEIMLLTEEQHVNGNDEIVDIGRKDPSAQRVAESITTYYTYIAQKRPIYHQLKELMRAYAVLEAMYSKRARTRSGIDLNYFLSQYRVPEYAVSATLPGRSRFEIERYRRLTLDGEEQASLVLPLCGGVAFEVILDGHNFTAGADPRLTKASAEIIRQRPHSRALFWDVLCDIPPCTPNT